MFCEHGPWLIVDDNIHVITEVLADWRVVYIITFSMQ